MRLEQSGGGILLDQGIHLVDIVNQIAGGFEDVHSLISANYTEDPALEDNVFVSLRNREKQISVSLHSTSVDWRYLFSLEIVGSDGSAILNGLRTGSGRYGAELLSLRRAETDQDLELDFTPEQDNSFLLEHDAFFNFIDGDSSGRLGTLDDMVNLQSLTDRIYAADQMFAAARQTGLKQAGLETHDSSLQ